MNRVGKAALGVVGLAAVVLLIAVPTALYLHEDNASESKRTFTLEDYFNSSLRPRSYSLRWISDREYLHKARDGSVYRHDAEGGSEGTVFLSREAFEQVKASDFAVSADQQYACLVSNYTKVWRHSFLASYSIYSITERSHVPTPDIPGEVQYLAWAPAGNKLAFVWNNDVYVKTSPTSPAQQVTSDGEPNSLLNGVPDWVYEEEMFSSNQALWWSPGGKHVAFARFNETNVHDIEYSWYGTGQYPHTVTIPYPKPGTPNPTVKLLVVDTENVTNVAEVAVPRALRDSEHYLSTVTWATDTRIAVQWQNRTQNLVLVQVYELHGAAWAETTTYVRSSKTGWVDRFSPSAPVFHADGESFYIIMSDTNGYKHIHHIREGAATAITSGMWEVISILKVTTDAIFFVGNQDHPGQRNVYRVASGPTASSPECLTCTFSPENCKYNSASFSHNAAYYRLDCSGPGIPVYALMNNTNSGSVIRVLEDNKELGSILEGMAMPAVVHGSFKIDSYDLWYQLTLPPEFDKSRKYPLLIDVYAGPCSQKSDFRFRVNWASYLSSTEKVVVASFDGRGSGYQGDQIMHSIYQRLGTYEVEDQITAARKFIDLGYIDKERIAIWGWSYGGYVTSMALGAGSGVFKCGMAVAPVSKWEYYDSIYTERYMRQPFENRGSYDNSTVTGRAKNFSSVQYLLVHGTADDNVHFQQAAQISRALVEEQVDFESMWYTDKDHGLGGSANHHVYTHMSHFLLKCFS
ncbi:dipeptidyl peptidase 4-like [Denticeps clupeoides]|uniref:dipeptidyl peptidase 4-like n=1 Tax=Denticeps clupeoides TaxID=299321 RepID=UPI0010A56D24|nr:dipeptidyl peptidase 4-like [Denticeps clupeoides]